MKTGFIGLGRMGSNMAAHILKAGHDLTVHDLRKEAAASLLKDGARWADSPKEVSSTCDIVITSLPSPVEVEQVVYGQNGLMAGWKRGDIYIDTTTASPDTAARVAPDAAAKGASFLDAPVTGGTKGAEEGKLVFIVGGEKATLEKARPVLQAMGEKIFHVGAAGSGTVAKLVNNLISVTSNAIMAEAFVMGVKAGVDPQLLWEVAVNGTADNWDLRRYPGFVFKGDFEPGFRLSLASKDVGLAVQLGHKLGVPMSVAEAVDKSYQAARAEGFGDKSIYAIFRPLEDLMGVKVRTTGS